MSSTLALGRQRQSFPSGALRNSKTIWRRLREQGPPKFCTLDGVVSIGIVDAYRHLGTVKSESGSPLQDGRARSAAMLKAYALLAHRVFANPSLDRGLRMRLASALLFTKLYFGTETWLVEHHPAAACIHAARMRVLRRVAGKTRHQPLDNVSDES